MLPKQNLVYAENDNPAWNAPAGTQYARNYKPNIIMTFSEKTGKQTFFVKTKSSIDNSPAGHKRMALFGGTQAMIAGIKKNPNLTADLYDEYVKVKDQYKSFNSWLAKWIRYGLSVKLATLDLGTVSMKNPWVSGGTGTEVVVNPESLRKFASELCPASIVIDGKVIAYAPSASMTMKQFVDGDFNAGELVIKTLETSSGEEIGNVLFYKNEVVYRQNGSGDDIYVWGSDVLSTLTDLTMTPPNA